MKHREKQQISGSIRRRLAIVFMSLMIGLIVAILLCNNLFLEKLYIRSRIDRIQGVYQAVNDALRDGRLEEESFQNELQNLLGRDNVSIMVVDQSFDIIISSVNEKDRLGGRLLDHIFNQRKTDSIKIIEENDHYTLSRNRDRGLNTEFLELWGSTDTGEFMILRSPVAAIRESVRVVNRFLWTIGLLVIVLGMVIVQYVSKKITDPIRQLADISSEMSELNFERRYEGHEKDELGSLGENINEMADKLQQAIGELKTANIKLQKDIEHKEQIDEMRKEFLSNVSHELKTPIALIQGYAEGLKEGISDDPESRAFYCEVIADEAGKMNTMVQKLLTLNRLEFGSQERELERFNLRALILSVADSMKLLAEQNQVDLYIDLPEQLWAWGDQFDVEEVFRNYLSNALNHVNEKKKIVVRGEELKEKIRIAVYNTGDPIPEAEQKKIWEKFYKIDKARTREYGGSGIGLSIVKAVMESMGQSYGVRNVEEGVEFWFELDRK